MNTPGSGKRRLIYPPRKTWWDGVKEDRRSFSLCPEDAQVKNKWRNKITEVAGERRFSWKWPPNGSC